MYEAEQRKHFGARYSEQLDWKSSLKIVPGNKPSKCIDEFVPNNKPPRVFTQTRPKPERAHLTAKTSECLDYQEIGVRTFIDIHNRKSINEFSTE